MNTVSTIAGVLLNTFWQAVALVFLVWSAIRILQPRVNAATRHLVWWIALAAILLLPCITRTGPSASLRQPPHPPATASTLPVRFSLPSAPPAVEAAVTVTVKRSARWPFYLLAIWAAVCLHRTVRAIRSYLHLRWVKRRALAWTRPLAGVKRPARLLLSSEISSPIAAGFLHPAVILPDKLLDQLTTAELDCVVLHESAHLARYDDWDNLIAQMAAAAVVLHPVAWWLLRQIEREREMACDDWVVAHTGMARSYAESLMRIVELRLDAANSVLASGIFTRRSRLRLRIEMLLRRRREFSPVASRIPLGAAALALAVLAIAGALAPHWIAFAQRPEFEVASVKPDTIPGPVNFVPRRSGDRITMHNTQPYMMIFYAYRLTANYQVVGYPDFPEGWRWYDIDARAGHDATDDEVRLMFQSLLADRFQLRLHRETRELPEYELTPGKGQPRMTPSSEAPMTVTIEDRRFTQRPGTCGISLWLEGSHLVCHAAPLEKIVAQVIGQLGAPVVDRTGLTGAYDLNVHFIPDRQKLDADAPPGPSLGDALQEELGLKLVKGKGPVEVLVIDHMEKPSEN
jgi:uncharacterized protein (TIGR03435 family)